MASSYPPVPMPLVQNYTYHYNAANNEPIDGNYKAALATYLIDVAAPTNALVPYDISRQIHAASGDLQTAFLLWLSTPGMDDDVELGCIVLLNSISDFARRTGLPATK